MTLSQTARLSFKAQTVGKPDHGREMMVRMSPAGEITQLLLRWRAGDEAALAALLPLVYQELRVMALQYLRQERAGHTLQRTALVHEAFLRLVDQRNVDWQGRSQFFGIASKSMRRILVEHARRRSAQKRGDGAQRVDLDALVSAGEEPANATDVDFEAIDAAVRKLEGFDASQGRLVELRFFGGLSIEETAEVVGTSSATVKREWALARAWLQRELENPT
jgi:RNA polymerase sigma factor (TIGR02999 family)